MGLINSIGAYFNKFLGGWTFGTQTDQLTMKNSAEIVGTTGTVYEHTFQNKNGIVAHLDDITISLPTDTTGSILFLNSSNDIDSDGTYFNWDKVNKRLNLKGNSDTVGNIFVAQNLSNTANLTLANSGVSTFNFGVGGRVYIAGAVGSGDTLFEIRRTSASSGGFIFRSDNSLNQALNTTNGAFNIGTVDNSNINLGMGSGVFTVSTNPSMSAINTGQRMMLGTFSSSSLSRWLNIGYNSTLGQILQSVQNGSTPTSDSLSLNPYGGSVTINALTSGQHANVNLADNNTAFRVYRISTTNGITMSQTTGGSGVFSIAHGDSTNTSGNANIAIAQGDTAYFSAGKQGQPTKNYLFGNAYGTITDFNTLIGHEVNRGIAFSNTNNTIIPAIIQGVHSGAARTLSLQYYGSNVGIGAIQPTAKLHIRGESDSVGTIFRAENLSNTSYFEFSNTGVLTTNQPSGGSNYTTLDFLRGGSKWLSLGSRAGMGQGLIFGNDVAFVTLYQTCLNFRAATSNNTNSEPAFDFINVNTLNPSNIANYRFRNQGTLAYSFGGSAATVNVFQIFNNFSLSTGNSSQFIRTLVVSPTINQTANAVNLIGIDYDPTITSITGAHYGLLIRPDTLNGIGLGSTLPSATLHIKSPNTVNSLKVDVGTVDSALLVNSAGEVTTRKFTWTIDLMLFTSIDLVADVNFKIVSVTNIKNSPTTTIQVNASPYTLGTNITLGDTINVQVSTLSVVRLNCELI
jgi:hypothetical protein